MRNKYLDERDATMRSQLDAIGKSIGYGRAIQLLGQIWDDMLQEEYKIKARHQEAMHRNHDIERIEAGLPLARKVVYVQKRGRKGQVTTLVPHDFEISNVAWIISDTWLYGRADQQDPVYFVKSLKGDDWVQASGKDAADLLKAQGHETQILYRATPQDVQDGQKSEGANG